MLTAEQIKRARAVLPTCKTLTDAEDALGGGILDDQTHRRDWKAAAESWALFDGFAGRPEAWNDKDHPLFAVDYARAYKIGKLLAADAEREAAMIERAKAKTK